MKILCPSHFDKYTKPCNTKNLTPETMQAHLIECENISLKCNYYGQMILKRDYLKAEVECDCELVCCEYCFVLQNKRFLDFHSDLCKETDVQCENCGNTYLRKDKKLHKVNECIVSCPFSDMECSAKQLRMLDYHQHALEAQETHVVLALKRIIQRYSKK